MDKKVYKVADLFAGIGGIRLGVEQAFGDEVETVYASEWNKYATQTYLANFPPPPSIEGDITEVDADSIPDFNILLAGFPCQPFSIAGVSKKRSLGRATGFEDATQGTLFFDVARIIKTKEPDAFLLENVKNLKSHDRGRTWSVIERTLRDELGYHIFPKVIDATPYTSQHRERIYIVGFKDNTADFDWDKLKTESVYGNVGEILLPDVGDKYILSDKLWSYLQRYAEKHRRAGNGFGYGIVDSASPRTRTLSARYYKDGSEILVSRGEGRNPRKLTPRECARLQGFPDSFAIPVSDTQAYKQFGNSVCVPVIKAIASLMKETLDELR